jgi:hypothetical protein
MNFELQDVETIYRQLLANPGAVVITANEALEIWQMFRPYGGQTARTFDNFKYRAFMQAAMMAWIDASSAVGFIKALWSGAMKPTATIVSVVRKLALETLKQYYRNEIKGEPDLYAAVRDAILYSQRGNFDCLQNGLEL